MGKEGKLSGQVVLLTGASRGIGEATAVALADAGADLVICARSKEHLDQVEAQCRRRGGQVLAQVCDVTRGEQVQAVVDATLQRFGRIDTLINNAGVGYYRRFLEITEDEWDHMFEVNVKGVWRFLKAVVPHMVARRSGLILTMSSLRGFTAIPFTTGYSATKHALQGLHAGLAKDLAQDRVRVALICPGGVRNDFSNVPRETKSTDWLTSEDVARAIVFMASEPASVVISQLNIEPAFVR